jgi:hypothetical protein
MTSLFETNWLIGTWEFTHTTARADFPPDVVYHFDVDGSHCWEFLVKKPPFPELIARQSYFSTPRGYWTTWRDVSRFFPCQPSCDEVVVTGVKDDLWWMRKLPEAPDYLRYFVAPCIGRLEMRPLTE